MTVNWDIYSKRINLSGNSIRERQINNLEKSITNNFQHDPSYFSATRNSTSINIRLVENSEQSSNIDFIKTILLEPGDTINNILSLGDVFTVGTDKWLCINIDPLHEIYYKGNVRLCNQTLTLITSVTKTLTGYDSLGRPIYTETPKSTSWDCIAETKIINADFDKPINLPEGKIFITIPYSTLVKEDMEFTMWGNKYKITGVDMEKVISGVGVMGIHAERVV